MHFMQKVLLTIIFTQFSGLHHLGAQLMPPISLQWLPSDTVANQRNHLFYSHLELQKLSATHPNATSIKEQLDIRLGDAIKYPFVRYNGFKGYKDNSKEDEEENFNWIGDEPGKSEPDTISSDPIIKENLEWIPSGSILLNRGVYFVGAVSKIIYPTRPDEEHYEIVFPMGSVYNVTMGYVTLPGGLVPAMIEFNTYLAFADELEKSSPRYFLIKQITEIIMSFKSMFNETDLKLMSDLNPTRKINGQSLQYAAEYVVNAVALLRVAGPNEQTRKLLDKLVFQAQNIVRLFGKNDSIKGSALTSATAALPTTAAAVGPTFSSVVHAIDQSYQSAQSAFVAHHTAAATITKPPSMKGNETAAKHLHRDVKTSTPIKLSTVSSSAVSGASAASYASAAMEVSTPNNASAMVEEIENITPKNAPPKQPKPAYPIPTLSRKPLVPTTTCVVNLFPQSMSPTGKRFSTPAAASLIKPPPPYDPLQVTAYATAAAKK